MRVRVRGIYATALTHLLDEEFEVVQASPPIRERFEATFSTAPADVVVESTADRQGVGVHGDTDGVDAVADRLAGLGRDAFRWNDPTPRGSVWTAEVTETLGSGALLDLGDGSGFLPYAEADGRVETGDRLRVQVRTPEPPWSDDRPAVATDLRVPGTLATLVRGGGPAAGAPDLADVLPTDPPEGWRVRWHDASEDASLEALDAALERVANRADALEAALDEAPDPASAEPGSVWTDAAAAWLWFGRETRFALDDRRRAVVPTMPGHHRIKAADRRASAAVDLAEAVAAPGPEDGFPFDAVTRQFGPLPGDSVAIAHGKPDGRRIVLGEGEVTDRDPEGTVTVRREMRPGGSYDALGVERRAGDVAITRFEEGRWWYPTVYRGAEGERRGTYVNVCTPVEVFPSAVRYVDLHVDVVKHADGAVERVDDDELAEAVEAGHVSEPLAEKARRVADTLEDAL